MNLAEKLKIDKESAGQSIVFFVDGKFYAAYERSAFLATKFLPPLKVTCRFRKVVDQTVAQVGFPASSLSKFANSYSILQQEDMFTLQLPADTVFDEKEFVSWKQSLPVTHESDGPHPSAKSYASIIESIKTFPLSRTPIEAMLFIADLKRRI